MNFHFVHINKTAGSSIEKALGLRFRHHTAEEIIREVGRESWNSVFTFAFVRNPWDRVVSHYSYRVQTDQTGLGSGSVGFAQWVSEAYGRQNREYYDKPKMFMPQSDWISDGKGELLVEFVGRFENLQADFDQVCERIGRPATDLPRLKSSQRGDYRSYYDPDTREIVAQWFRKDIENFGYKY